MWTHMEYMWILYAAEPPLSYWFTKYISNMCRNVMEVSKLRVLKTQISVACKPTIHSSHLLSTPSTEYDASSTLKLFFEQRFGHRGDVFHIKTWMKSVFHLGEESVDALRKLAVVIIYHCHMILCEKGLIADLFVFQLVVLVHQFQNLVFWVGGQQTWHVNIEHISLYLAINISQDLY